MEYFLTVFMAIVNKILKLFILTLGIDVLVNNGPGFFLLRRWKVETLNKNPIRTKESIKYVTCLFVA